MKKYRIVRDDEKFRVQVKKKLWENLWIDFGWKNIDYFFSKESAMEFLESIKDPVILIETDWI